MASPGPEVWFYHLESGGPAEALAAVLEKCLARGWRVVVRGREAAALDSLDAALWTVREDSFLPHGRDGPDAERQPILLTTGEGAPPNRADVLVVLNDAALDVAEPAGFARTLVMFDGRDPALVADARGRWKALKDAGASLSYWAQTPTGGWEKRA